MKMSGIILSIILLVLNVQITSGERCKYVLQNPKGSIKSPGYPSSYPGNLDCSWLIQVQEGYTITLKTDSFRLEGPSPSCEQDSLMIHDGYNASASAFNSPYCERNGPTTLLSTGNSIFIRFTTDSYGSFSGFHIEYSAEPNCNQTINAENGTLSSPRYPANYYSNANCNWNIITKPGTFVLLQFKDFLMEGTKSGIGQCYDYVSIYDVLHSGKHLLKTFCGYKIPGAVKSTNNQMLLTLYSDATVAGRGFLAYFSAQEKVCTEKEFKCREGTCIGKSLKCDGKKDCDDASDETGCKNQMTTTTTPIITSQAAIPPCTLKQFRCNNGTCIDLALRCNQEDDCGNGIDESNCADSCSVGNGGCSETCNNHHVWGPYCSCKNGYALDTDKHSCNEIDECRKNNGGCSDICTNFPGGFKCECSSEGYQIGADGKSCQDIDECSANPCSHECQNTNGSYRCKCRIGYRMSSIGNCFDINECAIGVADCHDCINTEGSFYCNCATGFIEVENSTRCEDVNECKYRNGGCSHNCTNTFGSFNCHCKDGFRPYDKSKRTCLDINECTQNNGGCQHLCVNNRGSYSCKCHPGFELANRTKCIDIDECNSITTNICQHGCLNTLGSFQCTCAKEYTISANGRTCLKKVNDSDCGLPGSKTPPLSGDRWSIANKGAWAWQAYLSFKFSVFEKVRSGCIATLINRQYLLTTAHCVYLRQGPVAPAQLQVWLGVENRKYSNKKSFAVEKVVIHPDFKNIKTKQNGDLALIKLKHPITTSMTIQPICFNQPQKLPIGAKVHLISWGRISQKRFSEQLRQIKVEIEEQSHCTWLWTRKYNYSKMVCAGFQAANDQICLPDSGSPVMVRSGKKQNWFLVGILAHGAGYPKEKACSSRYKTNAIYNLTNYYRWIVENLSENL